MTTSTLVESNNLRLQSPRSNFSFFNPFGRNPEETDDLISLYLNNLQANVPKNVSNKDKQLVLMQLHRILKANQPILRELTPDSDFIDTLTEQKVQLDALQQVTKPQQIAPILERLTLTLPTFDRNTPLTVAGAALLVLPSIAAQSAYQVYEGIPPGGIDLCRGQSGIFNSCLQGWVAKASSPANWVQFSRLIQQVGRDSNAVAFDLLVKVLTQERMANITISALEAPTLQNTTRAICSSSPFVWNSMQATAELSSLTPMAACDVFNIAFSQAAREAMNNTAYWQTNLIIAGSVIGFFVLVGVCVGAVCCARNVCKPDCC